MGGGGSKNTVQKSEVTQSTLPEYARPYYEGLMQRASTNLTTPYQTYDQERIADFTPEQRQTQQNIMGMQTPGQFGGASALSSAAGLGSLQASQYDPGQFNAQQIGMPNLQNYSVRGPQQFGGVQAAQYMSPFIQQALEPQMREAITSARRGQVAQDLGSARQGTYGGSRQLLASMERERNLGQQMGDIQSRGLQSAYESAQQQFERDRTAGMTTDQRNLEAALQTQQLGTQTGLAALQSNQQADLDRQRMYEQSRQFGAQQSLAGLAQANQVGQTLSNIGQTQQNAEAQRLGLQQGTAAQQQAMNQQRLDQQYQDFIRQRDYPMEQMQQYSSLLRGVPVTPNSTATTYAPSPGLGQQLVGAGLGALGMYKTLGS
jgi:hypothetical protein